MKFELMSAALNQEPLVQFKCDDDGAEARREDFFRFRLLRRIGPITTQGHGRDPAKRCANGPCTGLGDLVCRMIMSRVGGREFAARILPPKRPETEPFGAK